MNEILNVLERIKELLESKEELSGVKFILDFPNFFAPKPILSPTVVLGIKSLDVKTGTFSGYLGTKDSQEYFGNSAKLTIKVNIYIPKKDNSNNNFNIFYSICNKLLQNVDNFSIISVLAKETKYESSIDAFLLEGEFVGISLILFEENR